MKINICPRCGEKYSYIESRDVNGRTYYYAVHYEYVDGKRRVRRCYLGPDTYTYVSMMHSREGLILKGLHDPSRILDYLDAILRYLRELETIEPETAKTIRNKARAILREIKRLLEAEAEPQIYGAEVRA